MFLYYHFRVTRWTANFFPRFLKAYRQYTFTCHDQSYFNTTEQTLLGSSNTRSTSKYKYCCKKIPLTPQRSNAARLRNMNRFNGGKSPGNSKHFLKTSKDKAVPGNRNFKRWVSVEEFLFVYLWLYRLVLCFVTAFAAKLSYELRSVNDLNWYRFFKAMTGGCDVGFYVWPRWNPSPYIWSNMDFEEISVELCRN